MAGISGAGFDDGFGIGCYDGSGYGDGIGGGFGVGGIYGTDVALRHLFVWHGKHTGSNHV